MSAGGEWIRQWERYHNEQWPREGVLYLPQVTREEQAPVFQFAAVRWFWEVGVVLGLVEPVMLPMIITRRDVRQRVDTFFGRWENLIKEGRLDDALKEELEVMSL